MSASDISFTTSQMQRPAKTGKKSYAKAIRGSYYNDLRVQMLVNEDQLDKLKDLLFVEKIRAAFYLAISLLVIGLLGAIVALLLSGGRFDLVERYSTLVNIAAVFLFFGLVETFSLFVAALSLMREIGRLIRQHIAALKQAEAEFIAA